MLNTDQQGTAALGPELDFLSREAEALTVVLKALEEEHAALISNDPARLESAVSEKNSALDRYMAAKASREAQGISDNIKDAIANHPRLSEGQRASGIELATAMRAAGENCQKLNQRNGMLIHALRDHTKRALNLVRGGESGVTLYGQQGRADDPDAGSRVLGTA